MQTEYSKKVIGESTTTKAPTKDGEIFQDGSTWKFKWTGSECGYATEKAAEEGLVKVSGKASEED